jgi:hypothetical protein
LVQLIKLGVESSEGLGNKCNLKIGSFNEQSGIVNFLNSVTGA